ncbi:type II secretion system minor pseudopilin GspI [Moritella yayanosii]|uniref:Type II secretion system protein I n=1 Tax=Moritella yayanosii TaxID=69539 RepID=A0A330LQ84_9GAMM|nr:type II secretion system minor pseudopilin GspI [Moritella yayanosii]SQD79154.1 Type II secretion system protein I [Moritella yayanosii]
MKSRSGHSMLFKQAGMTLLEVMVAMAVFATAGLAVMKVATENLSSLAYLEEKTFANWVAANTLTELKLANTIPGKSWRQGESELAGRIWYWRYKAEATDSSDFVEVTVEVATDKKYESTVSHLLTYVVR